LRAAGIPEFATVGNHRTCDRAITAYHLFRTERDLDALAAARESDAERAWQLSPRLNSEPRYLAGFCVEAAKLPNIGPARCAVLRSWGIDTAADVDEGRIVDIPAFGRSLTDKLVIWRDVKEKAFVYNAAPMIDPLEVQRGSSLRAAPADEGAARADRRGGAAGRPVQQRPRCALDPGRGDVRRAHAG